MKNRFAQQQMPNNDKNKFDLACKLMVKKMEVETGMPNELARVAAFSLVSDIMQATEKLRERVALRWRQQSATCVN